MDFFERQDKARRNTKLLVFYFVVAVACIIAGVYFACLVVFAGMSSGRSASGLWNPGIFIWATLGTLAVVVFGSLFKISALAGGGKVVAESLGGRPVDPASSDPDERKLLNVVEEMALASGVPVPPVYVLDSEMGINAFAAGYSTSDAVVAVTRGCLKALKRDELQGVIGHEFSHVLNGDMRLNLRLIGIIFGILCLATIGRILLRTRGRKNPLPLLGLALIVIGGVGVLFGRLIQAAVSRQREFLADASSVQFTRNPAGLSGALQKIGGAEAGSEIENEHAPDACHMFFGNALRRGFLGAFATHPPLEERIRAIDPGWDGRFHPVEVTAEIPLAASRRSPQFAHLVSALGSAPARVPPVIKTQTVLPSLGQPTPLHLRYAEDLRDALPENLKSAARDPASATALMFALLLSEDSAMRAQQLQQLDGQAGATTQQRVAALWPEVAAVAARARLPLVALALPALKQLRPDEFLRFSRALKRLVESDQQVDLFEFVLQKIVARHLAPQFGKARPPVVQFYTARPLAPDCAVLLSALAHVSSAGAAEVAKAFGRGLPYLRILDVPIPLLPREQAGLEQIDAALNRLALAVPQIKKNVLEACIQVVGADGVIQEREAELLRAIADTLDCPIPPFVTTE